MVQSVERTLDILEALASAPEDVTLSQLHTISGLPLGTVHRLVSSLIERGYADQDKTTRRYGPGPKILEIAAAAMRNNRFSLRYTAQPILQTLTATTSETSNLVVLQGHEIVYVDQVVSPRLVRMFTEVGRRSPLYCTGAGKAILSALSPHQVAAYLSSTMLEPITPYTLTSASALRQELDVAQQRGYAVDNEEREEGVRCVAAPIFDHMGLCIAALSISGPTTRVTAERVHELGSMVRDAAAACSIQLGYRAETSTFAAL